MSFNECNWLNEPSEWRLASDELFVTTDDRTDFWRDTYYGFTRDSGHFFGLRTTRNFTAELRINARYEQLYDQAGIMVRRDGSHWVKAGIEMSDGRAHLSSVLTLGRSDWATAVYTDDPDEFWLRATVKDGVLRLQISADGRSWPLLRLAPFPKSDAYWVGPMCCTPERAGLQVRFADFRVAEASEKPLHDLS
jgi:regulation of enolase protein 1 (concanavalin A-like superfamily)